MRRSNSRMAKMWKSIKTSISLSMTGTALAIPQHSKISPEGLLKILSVGTSIKSEFLVKNLLGNMPLVPTNKHFKSPLGLFFKCCGIARDVPITINKNEVHADFHIFAILEFKLLIGHPLDNLFQENPSQGSLNGKLEKTASATLISRL